MVEHQEDMQDPATVEKRGHEKGEGVLDLEGLISEAREASDSEHRMSLWQGVKLYPKAVGWSIVLSTALVMEGYDTLLMGSLYGEGAFQKRYGVPVPGKPGKYQITAPWQAGLSNGAAVGEILGLFVNGWVSERYGYRKVMIVSLFAVICFIFLPFFSHNLPTYEAGEVLCGIPWGVFQTLTTTYASEVCPIVLRYYLTTYVNLCWVMGQLIGSGVMRGVEQRTDQWAYRIPFAVQWVWPIPLIIGVFLAPESPWWLVRKNRPEDAAKALRRLTSKYNSDEDIQKTVAMMIHTNSLDLELTKGTNYWDCFKGTDLRRTEIVCAVWACQNLCGNAFMGYSTYFFEQAGLSKTRSFDLSIGMYAVGWCFTLLSWWFMKFWGRRTLYVGGMTGMVIVMLITGGLGTRKKTKANDNAIGAMLIIFTAIYDGSIGPACYSLVPELSSNRLRTKQIVLARNVYNIFGIIDGVITPYMLNPLSWNWGAKAGFFWAGIGFLCLVWTYFRLPEPKGRTYAELDILFEKRISARKFKSTEVDVYDIHQYDASQLAASEPVVLGMDNIVP